MLFNSWTFAVFLVVVFFLHYLGRSAAYQALVLTVGSFVFYGWGADHLRLVPLLIASTLINGVAAQVLLSPVASLGRKKTAFGLALAFNLAALGFFKYARLIGQSLLPAAVWAQWEPTLGHIPLPVGISFYTFQGISLICEAWRVRSTGLPGLEAPKGVQHTLWFHLKVWFFKAFFPQLIAGPIVKAHEFLHQIGFKRLRDIDWDGAVRKLVLGFFLKMVIADNLTEATGALDQPDQFEVSSRLNLLAMLYGFSFQIFSDFAGYSLIAQGLAKLFGYELPINFNFPYLSQSITEFWRRWHISLSSWLREYLYIPLGGNRFGIGRTYLNLFLVMFLGGLWHGAEWRFAAWGTAHGLLLAAERLFQGQGRRGTGKPGWTMARILRAVLVFNVISVLWLLFKLPHFSSILTFFKAFAGPGGAVHTRDIFAIALFSLPPIAWHFWAAMRERIEVGKQSPGSRLPQLELAVYGVMLALIVLNPGTAGEFIYFQF
ncbi:MAG TPA: MBOAT family O-acyltransferase [Candidatus Limnocylindria bacterium]|jgi:alginate O-acetyltransferase complex protein AlgI|nr:MBOAT family O-acyltransferase [Candidatus Limnocylindria bacterium]